MYVCVEAHTRLCLSQTLVYSAVDVMKGVGSRFRDEQRWGQSGFRGSYGKSGMRPSSCSAETTPQDWQIFVLCRSLNFELCVLFFNSSGIRKAG